MGDSVPISLTGGPTAGSTYVRTPWSRSYGTRDYDSRGITGTTAEAPSSPSAKP